MRTTNPPPTRGRAATPAAAVLAALLAGSFAVGLAASSGCGPDGEAGRLTEAEARNVEVVRAFAVAVDDRDAAALDTLLTDDYVRHSEATPGVTVRGRQDYLEYLRDDLGAFTDARLELEKVVAQGDQVAFWGTYRGTQEGTFGVFPATGESLRIHFAGIHRLEGGRVAETWITWDNLTALVQLGHWEVRPPDDPPEEGAFCAVWVPPQAPAVDGTATSDGTAPPR